MKILVAVIDMDAGGVTTSVLNFCNELIERGHQIDFINIGKADAENEAKLNSNVNKINISGVAKYWQLGARDLKSAPAVKKIPLALLALVKKFTNKKGRWHDIIFKNCSLEDEYDVAIAYRQCAPCYYFVLNCVKAKTKIGFIHGELAFMGDISSWDCYFSQLDKIACVSNAVRDGFVEKYDEHKSKFCTVYNMLDIARIKALSNEKCDVEMNENKFNILTVARIENASKRIDIIPDACKKLVERGITNFHWYIVGDGDDLEADIELAKNMQVEDYITFCGAYDNPYPIFKKADCFVLTSVFEAFGIVVLEALILKKPVIATNYRALKEVLKDNEQGLIAQQSVDDLVEKLALLINDNKHYTNIINNLNSNEITNELAYQQLLDIF